MNLFWHTAKIKKKLQYWIVAWDTSKKVKVTAFYASMKIFFFKGGLIETCQLVALQWIEREAGCSVFTMMTLLTYRKKPIYPSSKISTRVTSSDRDHCAMPPPYKHYLSFNKHKKCNCILELSFVSLITEFWIIASISSSGCLCVVGSE